MPTIVVGPDGESRDQEEFLRLYPDAVLHADDNGEYWVIPHA